MVDIRFEYMGTTYRLTADEFQWIVQKYRGVDPKDGREMWRPCGYYATLTSGLLDLCERRTREMDAKTFARLQVNIERSLDQLVDALGHTDIPSLLRLEANESRER